MLLIMLFGFISGVASRDVCPNKKENRILPEEVSPYLSLCRESIGSIAEWD